jgi:hypothetical protein
MSGGERGGREERSGLTKKEKKTTRHERGKKRGKSAKAAEADILGQRAVRATGGTQLVYTQ